MRLNYQITVSFLPFMLFVCITLGLIQFALIYQSRMDDARSSLETTALLQSNRVYENLAAQESILGSLSSRTKLRRSMARWNTEKDPAAQSAAEKILQDAVQGTRNVLAVHALDPQGRLIASTKGLPPGDVYPMPELINDFGYTNLADFAEGHQPLFLNNPNNQSQLIQLMIAPAVLDEQLVGYLVVKINPVVFSRLIEDYIGMGDTGETMIGQRASNGDAVFLSPLRFADQSRSGGRVLAEHKAVPINRALNGIETFIAGAPDYRGEQVIAVTRQISTYELGVVAKMDRDEVMRPVLRSAGVTVISLLVIFVILLLISRLLARSIAKPLEDLTDKAEQALRKRHIWKSHEQHLNEVSILSTTINKLLDELYRAEQGLSEERLGTRHRDANKPAEREK